MEWHPEDSAGFWPMIWLQIDVLQPEARPHMDHKPYVATSLHFMPLQPVLYSQMLVPVRFCFQKAYYRWKQALSDVSEVIALPLLGSLSDTVGRRPVCLDLCYIGGDGGGIVDFFDSVYTQSNKVLSPAFRSFGSRSGFDFRGFR